MPDQDNKQSANPQAPPAAKASIHDREFSRRVLYVFAIATLFLVIFGLIWYAGQILLLLFSGVLFAVMLRDACRPFDKYLHLPHMVSLIIVVLLGTGLITLFAWVVGPSVAEQMRQLLEQIPSTLQNLRDYLAQVPILRALQDQLPASDTWFEDITSLLRQAGMSFTGVFGWVGSFVIIVFLGIYLAAQPKLYIDGAVKLLPRGWRERGNEVMDELGISLTYWLRGKLLSMLVVGLMTGLGLSWLGVPLPFALGVVAGLFDFIPYLGPILAGVPAVLIALMEGPTQALYVLLLLLAIQNLESYVLTPVVMRKAVLLPPALTIVAQVFLGVTFGLFGVAIATPLLVVVAVLVSMLYVQDVLQDRVRLPSDRKESG